MSRVKRALQKDMFQIFISSLIQDAGGWSFKSGRIKFERNYFRRFTRKMDRRSTHKKGQKGLALEQPYANFIKILFKSLERQYKELYSDISYIDIAQSVHILFTYYSLALFFVMCDFFVRLTSPFIFLSNFIRPLLYVHDSS